MSDSVLITLIVCISIIIVIFIVSVFDFYTWRN